MKSKLTDSFLLKHKSPDSGREEIFDTQIPGFGIRIGQSERAFFFIRRVNGVKARFSLGQYPAVTLSAARAQAFEILSQIKMGEDPRDRVNRRKQKIVDDAENTFGRLAERFLNEYATGKKKPLRPQTVKGYKWALTGEPTETWQRMAIGVITDRDIINIIERYEAKKHFASARLLRAYLHRFFRWTVEKRILDKNPATSIPLASTPSDFKRERVLTIDELRLVLEAAQKLKNPAAAFVYLLALTGQRRGEASLTKWSDLDFEADPPKWSIPAENAKNRIAHDVPLSSQIACILSGVPRIGEYVFTTDGRTPISGFSKIKAKLDGVLSESYLDPWTFHDLRRSAATGMANLGVAPHTVETILNHVSGLKSGVAGIYNKSKYNEERKRALWVWAEHLLASELNTKILQN